MLDSNLKKCISPHGYKKYKKSLVVHELQSTAHLLKN